MEIVKRHYLPFFKNESSLFLSIFDDLVQKIYVFSFMPKIDINCERYNWKTMQKI